MTSNVIVQEGITRLADILRVGGSVNNSVVNGYADGDLSDYRLQNDMARHHPETPMSPRAQKALHHQTVRPHSLMSAADITLATTCANIGLSSLFVEGCSQYVSACT